jgi:hypothetical protein
VRISDLDLAGTDLRQHDVPDTDLRHHDPTDTDLRHHDPADTDLRHHDPADTDLQYRELAGADAGDHELAGAEVRDAVESSGARTEDGANSPETRPERDDWYRRPWKERVQATDVAIAGLLLVILLVGGLVFLLTRPSTVVGSEPLAVRPASPPSHNAARSQGHTQSGTNKDPAATTTPSLLGGSPALVTTSNGAGASGSSPAAEPPDSARAAPSSVSVSATGAPTQACTPGDLTISTVVQSENYPFSSGLTVTTQLVDNVACVFDPVPSGPYSCPTTVTVVNQVGDQVYPYPAQGEQCGQVAAGALSPGESRTVSLVWSQAAPGTYSGVGSWSWGQTGTTPYQVSASSQPYTVGPSIQTPSPPAPPAPDEAP